MSLITDYVKNGSDYKLAFVGSANWDIHINSGGHALAIAKEGNSAKDSFFGDVHHIRRLMAEGNWTGNRVTEWGLECMSGLFSKIYEDRHGKKFSILRWAHLEKLNGH